MSSTPPREDFFPQIRQAIEKVAGKKPVTMDSYFVGNLGIESIEMADIFFELEKITGLKIGFRELLLSTGTADFGSHDLQVRQVVDHLNRLAAVTRA